MPWLATNNFLDQIDIKIGIENSALAQSTLAHSGAGRAALQSVWPLPIRTAQYKNVTPAGDTHMKTVRFTTALIAGAMALPLVWAQSPINKADSDRLIAIAQANIAEIAAGKLAVEKSSNADVKKFAQMMIDDHSKGLSDTQKIAAAKNVTLPTEPDAPHKKMAAELKQLSGAAFDKTYISKAGAEDHVKVHAALKDDIANAKDADVKGLASQLEPVVAHHEEMAKKLDAATK